MKFFRYWRWLAAAFFKKHWKTLAGAAVLGIVALSSFVRYYPAISKVFGQETRIGMVGRVSPGSLPIQVSSLISYGLTKVAGDGRPEPDLAFGWETNEEGTEYTFKIDTSKKWSDQTPVRAGDLGISIENVETEIQGEDTIIFKLVDPYAPFPALVSRPIFKNDLIGLGPDKVAGIKGNGEFIDELILQKPDNQKIKFRFYRTGADLITAFKLGEVDEIRGMTSLAAVPKWDKIEISRQLNFDIYTRADPTTKSKIKANITSYKFPNTFSILLFTSQLPNSYFIFSLVNKILRKPNPLFRLVNVHVNLAWYIYLWSTHLHLPQSWQSVYIPQVQKYHQNNL